MGQYLCASREAAAMVPRKTYGVFFLTAASWSWVRPSLVANLLRRLGEVLLRLWLLGWEKEWEKEWERDGKWKEEEEGPMRGVWGGVW